MADHRLLALLAFLAATAGACGADRTIHEADARMLALRSEYENLAPSSIVSLAGPEEPGTRLLIMGRLVRSETGEPVPGHVVTLFQTDAEGSYREAIPGDEATARLRGDVETDSLGRFFVRTIVPGGYGGSPGSGHIHTAVTGARPEFYDFFFSHSIGAGLRRWADGTDQGIVLDLASTGGELIGVAELRVRELAPPAEP